MEEMALLHGLVWRIRSFLRGLWTEVISKEYGHGDCDEGITATEFCNLQAGWVRPRKIWSLWLTVRM